MIPSELARFFRDKGDETVRINYNLNNESIVLDLGFYLGNFADAITKKYDCTVYGYEPIVSHFNNSKERFKDNAKVKVFNYGLGEKNQDIKISNNNESSSIYDESFSSFEVIKIRDIVEELQELSLPKIDLLKINIEGSEYTLLDRMIKADCISKIDNIQVQFHMQFEKEITRNYLQSLLSKTHVLTYNYGYVWENWKLK